jgi:transposase
LFKQSYERSQVQTETITVELGLPGLRVPDSAEFPDRLEIAAEFQDVEATCPRCGRPTWRVHQRSKQRKRDLECWGRPVWVYVWKRRFRCRPCRYVFTEDDPVCGRRRRTTRRLRRRAAQEALEATVCAVSGWHGISQSLVQRSWLEFYGQVDVATTPHVLLGLDGFCVRRPGVMWTGIWDLQTRRPVAVMKGERTAEVQKLLERHADRDSVKAVAMDLSEASRQAVHMTLPDARIVADKFHVVALVHRALQEVRGGRRLPGNTAWLMHRNVEGLRPEEGERLAQALIADPSLAAAWRLKEGLRAVYRKRTKEEAATAMQAWLRDAAESGLRPFQRTSRTLTKWREEVLNYWDYRITNAMVEGKHNRVKVLKRRAYGYRNDRTFSLRILNLFHT